MHRLILIVTLSVALLVLTLAARGPAAHALDDPLVPAPTTAVYLPSIANPPTPTPAPTPVPAPLADGVYALSQSGYADSPNYHVFLELRNDRSATICFVRITASFYDAAGALLATKTGYTMFTHLAPGQVSPVHVFLSPAPANIASYTLAVVWQNACSSFQYRDVTVLSHNLRDDLGAEIYGEVRNDTPQTLKSVKAVVTFYDPGGRIRFADFGYLSGGTVLAPGQTGAYTVHTYEPALNALPYTVRAQGYFTPGQ
jgi:hypothetical protein